jgi:hypothetical protein
MTQLEAMAATLAIEACAGALLAPKLGRQRWKVALVLVAGSLCTHPFAWASNQALAAHWAFAPRAALIEVVVAIVEGAMLALALRVAWRPALATGFAVNAASFGLGLLWWWWGVM